MENNKTIMCEQGTSATFQVKMDDYIQFQIVEWLDLDNNGKYTVLIFGRDGEGKSVTLQVNDYKPFYYVKPNKQDQVKNTEKKLKKIILQGVPVNTKKKINQEYEDPEEGMEEEEELKNLFEYKIEKKKDFYYFCNNREEKYFKIVVQTKMGKYKSKTEIEKLNKNQKDQGKKIKFYEINGDPYIKLIHERNVNPAGWIRVKKEKLRKYRSTDVKTSTMLNYAVKSYKDIERSDLMEIAPLKISAFDLECRPIRGRGFPKASKGYTIGQDIYDRYFTNMNVQDFNKVGWFIIGKLQGHQNNVLPEKVHMDIVREKIILGVQKKYNVHKKKYKEADDFKKVELREDYIQQMSSLFIQQREYWQNFEGDPIIQIGLTTSVLGQDIKNTHRCIFTLKQCKIKDEECKDVDIRECKTEGELIEKFCEEVDKIDPDIITGYNTSGFDNQYLYHRAQELQKTESLKRLSRLSDLDWGDDENVEERDNSKYQKYFVKYKITKLSSSALGKNDLKYIQTYGRVQMDLYKKIQRDEKLESYKLDNVADKLIGERKDDITPEKIFDYFEEGNKYRIGLIAKYCVQDCVLCNKIIFKKDIITKEIAMANVCTVPLSYIFHRGQGVKIYSLVLKQTTLNGFVIEDRKKQIDEYQIKKQQAQQKEEEKKEKEKQKREKEKEKKKKEKKKGEPQEEVQEEEEEEQSTILDDEDEETFSGATVLEPKTGIYSNQMISVFDYASLYPSSMIEYNVSHDTLIREGDKLEFPEDWYTKPVNVNFSGDEDQDEQISERKQETYRFIKSEHYLGIIPQILQNLLQQRKKVRKLIPQEPDSGKRKILDSQQLAYKITANSIYGQCGASTSQISLQPLAKVTTAVGRQMLQKAINFFQFSYQSEIIYGDSVAHDTPILIKYPNGQIDIKTIDDLSDQWESYEQFKLGVSGLTDKQQSYIDAEVWTNGQWSKIRRVIRHKTNKQMYRVNTFEGCVDVTEDHSLIDINGQEIKPTEVKVGETKLLHSFPTEFPEQEIKVQQQLCDKFNLLSLESGEKQKCIKCYKQLDLQNFYKQKTSKSGYQNTCKLCVKERACRREGKHFDGELNSKVLNYDIQEYSITKFEAWVFGFFYGDGSCNHYECLSGTKRSWAINNQNLEFLEKARQYLLKIEPKSVVSDFKVLDTKGSSGVYKLVPVGSFKYMVNKYRSLMYDKEDYKKVPQLILNGSYEIRSWFMKGYLTADGEKGNASSNEGINSGNWKFDNLGKIGAQGLYYLMKSLNWKHVRINIREDKSNIYTIRNVNQKHKKRDQQVMHCFNVTEQYKDEYVYDIETESGLFQAGVGSQVVSNTDSCFIILNEEAYIHKIDPNAENKIQAKLKALFEKGKEIEQEFQKLISDKQKLEFEKILYPVILFAKKRYYGYSHESEVKSKLITTGTIATRRDSCRISKDIYGETLDILMGKKSKGKEDDIYKQSIDYIQDEVKRVLRGDYDKTYFKFTKTYKGDNEYKSDNLPHVQVVRKMQAEGKVIEPSERIEYYIARRDAEENQHKLPQYKKAVSAQDLEKMTNERSGGIDYINYIEKQIKNPLIQIYSLNVEKLIQRLPQKYITMGQYEKVKEAVKKGKYEDNEKNKKKYSENEIQQKIEDRISDINESIVKKLIFNEVVPTLADPGMTELKRIKKQEEVRSQELGTNQTKTVEKPKTSRKKTGSVENGEVKKSKTSKKKTGSVENGETKKTSKTRTKKTVEGVVA